MIHIHWAWVHDPLWQFQYHQVCEKRQAGEGTWITWKPLTT